MLNGLDLFSGIGGMSLALKKWVRPIAYCEIDPYCQGVLLSRMGQGSLGKAPICSDVRVLTGRLLPSEIDIIYGGFPCQDISVAGLGKGLEGERSGLFFEIVRLAQEIQPSFIFLENVPAITSRGGLRVVREITEMGYDSRWCVISAASVGAWHKRDRWFLLAHANSSRRGTDTSEHRISSESKKLQFENGEARPDDLKTERPDVTNYSSLRCDEGTGEGIHPERQAILDEKSSNSSSKVLNFWENSEPPVCGVADGFPFRVDQIRALGNAVVPEQAKEAFKILMGLQRGG